MINENPSIKEVYPLRTLFRAFLIEARQLSEEKIGDAVDPTLLVCCSLHKGMLLGFFLLFFFY